MSEFHDVIVAGAGPVGLFLACELKLAGASVLVLEREPSPLSPLKALPFGMRGLSSPTLEALDRRGLLDEVLAAHAAAEARRANNPPQHWSQQHQQRRPAGHFAGIPFFGDDVDAASWPFRLPTPVPFNLATDVQSLEAILARRAATLGVEIRRGRAVEKVAQDHDEVTVHAGGQTHDASWLVGCDGGRSTIRKAAGFEFVGTDPEFTGYSVQVQLADGGGLVPGRTYTPAGMYTYARPGTIAMVDFDGGAFHRTQPITHDHVQAVLRRVSGTEATVAAVEVATTWTDRAYQATEYRRGRVLLAGDAAHIHSPLGGQGLNLGLGDAINLGWKLAATIRGTAPAGLLETYFAERHPEGARILDWSRAQVALMRPTPSTRALAAVMRDLIATGAGATYFAGRIWGLALHYDLAGAHPLVGRSVPDFVLGDGRRTGALLRDGKGLLLDFTCEAGFQAFARRWSRDISYATGSAQDRLGLQAILVRPDGIVAWVGEGSPDPGAASRAASRWFAAAALCRPGEASKSDG